MTERTIRSRKETNTQEKSTYPRWAKVAAGVAALSAAGIGGYNTLHNDSSHELRTQDTYTVYSLDQAHLSDSEYVSSEGSATPIGAAMTIIDKRIQSRNDTPELTSAQRMSLMNSANIASKEFYKEHGTPQPDTIVAVYSGEFDGEPGIDWRVQLKTPEDASEPGPSIFSDEGKQELPSYFSET